VVEPYSFGSGMPSEPLELEIVHEGEKTQATITATKSGDSVTLDDPTIMQPGTISQSWKGDESFQFVQVWLYAPSTVMKFGRAVAAFIGR